MSLLDIRDLSISFGTHPVVHGRDQTVDRGETVALVGESGSGKSITALALMGLLPRRALRTGGQVLFDERDISSIAEDGLRQLRGPGMGMIFQEPMTSLTPVLTIGRQMTEALVVHRGPDAVAADPCGRDAVGQRHFIARTAS